MTGQALSELRSLVETARRWTGRSQSCAGTWSDFKIGVGGRSDEWVTAYVCDAIDRWRTQHDGHSGASARAALRRVQRRDGGWGYNQRIPSDADTTGLAVLALCHVQTEFDRAASVEFLLSSHDEDLGGFKTYRSPVELEALYRDHPVRAMQSFGGWCSSHVEVTASVLEALQALGCGDSKQARTASAFLLSMQDGNGCWTGYWAMDAFYPTCRAVRALTHLRLGGKIDWTRLVDTLLAQQRPDGSWTARDADQGCPFRTALAIETLCHAPVLHVEAIGRAVTWLRFARYPEGHWTCRYPFMRVPPPDVTEPDEYVGWSEDRSGLGATYADCNGILTSATVISALQALHHRMSSSNVPHEGIDLCGE